MITYGGGAFGSKVLIRLHGSAVAKSVTPAILSSLVFMVLFEYTNLQVDFDEEDDLPLLDHPYPMAALITAFSFLLIFRANFSYNRYWEAHTAIHTMHAKWLDLATEIAAFHLQSHAYNSVRPPSFGANARQLLLQQQQEQRELERLREDLTQSTTQSKPTPFNLFRPQKLEVEGAPVDEKGNLSDDLRNSTTTSLSMGLQSLTTADIHSKPTLDTSSFLRLSQPTSNIVASTTSPNKNRRQHEQITQEELVQQIDAQMEQQKQEQEKLKANTSANRKNLRSRFRKGTTRLMAFRRRKRPNGQAAPSPKESTDTRPANDPDEYLTGVMRRRANTTKAVKFSSEQYRGSVQDNLRSEHRDDSKRVSSGSPYRPSYSIKSKKIRHASDFFDEDGRPYSSFWRQARLRLQEGRLDPKQVAPAFLEEAAHLLSLLSAVALSTLRNDLEEVASPLAPIQLLLRPQVGAVARFLARSTVKWPH